MRVLVLHNRYRQPGGEDAVARRETAMLRAHGVDVVKHEVDNEVEHEVLGNVALLARSAWSLDWYDTIRRMCEEFRPDVVHVHNFWMRLTPSVHAAAQQAGAATVQTLHKRLSSAGRESLRRLPWNDALARRDSPLLSRFLSGLRRRRAIYHAQPPPRNLDPRCGCIYHSERWRAAEAAARQSAG